MYSPQQGIEAIKRKQNDAKKESTGFVTDLFLARWRTATRQIVEDLFGEHSQQSKEFAEIGTGPLLHFPFPEKESEQRNYAELQAKKDLLDGFIETLEEKVRLSSLNQEPAEIERSSASREIFIVHGHNTSIRDQVSIALMKLKLTPIILQDQPNQGNTVIEKFEKYSDVGFAVVLLTADDHGNSKNSSVLNLRARQNVIFELGYFFGKLKRSRVCVLYEKGVELPSDFLGIVYIPYDEAGQWQRQLIKELNAAKYEFDAYSLI